MVGVMCFGVMLREHREAAGISQEALAARSGVSVETISQWERGQVRRPRRSTLRPVASALRLDQSAVDALLAATATVSAPEARVGEADQGRQGQGRSLDRWALLVAGLLLISVVNSALTYMAVSRTITVSTAAPVARASGTVVLMWAANHRVGVALDLVGLTPSSRPPLGLFSGRCGSHGAERLTAFQTVRIDPRGAVHQMVWSTNLLSLGVLTGQSIRLGPAQSPLACANINHALVQSNDQYRTHVSSG